MLRITYASMGTAPIALIFVLGFPMAAAAHGGGLDGVGCHNDNKHGGYHCHRGPLAGRSFSSKAEALEAMGGGDSAKAPSGNMQRLLPGTAEIRRGLRCGMPLRFGQGVRRPSRWPVLHQRERKQALRHVGAPARCSPAQDR